MTTACSTKSAPSLTKPGTSTSATTFGSLPNRRTSCGTVCSSNSSCLLQKRKPANPLQASVRTFVRTPSNAVKQRVLSAKLIKLRSIQSQLNDANFHLTELSRENRALKTLQNRQDKALQGYEGTNADLPRLIKSHEEELRVVQQKNRVLRKLTKEFSEQIKVKDEEINSLSDQLKHLTALSKDKHLEEREKLSEKLEEAASRLKEHEELVNVLNRKLILETKNCRFKLSAEILKHKQCQRELGQALMEIGKLNGIIEGKNKSTVGLASQLNRRRIENHMSAQKASQSTTDLSNKNFTTSSATLQSSSDINLAPIKSALKTPDVEQPINVMASPSENIRFRLSSGSDKDNTMVDLLKNGKSRPASVKLEKIVNSTPEKETEGTNSDDVKLMDLLNRTKNEYKVTQTNTNSIIQSLKEADSLDQKLRKNSRLSEAEVPKKDRDIVNEIWQSEFSFRKSFENGIKSPTPGPNPVQNTEKYDFRNILTDEMHDIDSDVKFKAKGTKPELNKSSFAKNKAPVKPAEKSRLLATLRAIDNGESFDSVVSRGSSGSSADKLEIRTHTSENLMKELFGDT